jgi:hypothetical protein
MRRYAEILRRDFATSFDPVGPIRAAPHPPTRRHPDQKSLQAEATTCRTPEAWTARGSFLWQVLSHLDPRPSAGLFFWKDPAVPAIAALRRHFPAATTSLIMANQCLAIPSQLCLSACLWATFAIRSHSAALARYSSFGAMPS